MLQLQTRSPNNTSSAQNFSLSSGLLHTTIWYLLYDSNVPHTQRDEWNSLSLIPYLRSDHLSMFSVPKNDQDRNQGVIFNTFLSCTLTPKPSQSPINFTLWIFLMYVYLHFHRHLCNIPYNLTRGVTSHHLCHILLVRSKSEVLPTLKGRIA